MRDAGGVVLGHRSLTPEDLIAFGMAVGDEIVLEAAEAEAEFDGVTRPPAGREARHGRLWALLTFLSSKSSRRSGHVGSGRRTMLALETPSATRMSLGGRIWPSCAGRVGSATTGIVVALRRRYVGALR